VSAKTSRPSSRAIAHWCAGAHCAGAAVLGEGGVVGDDLIDGSPGDIFRPGHEHSSAYRRRGTVSVGSGHFTHLLAQSCFWGRICVPGVRARIVDLGAHGMDGHADREAGCVQRHPDSGARFDTASSLGGRRGLRRRCVGGRSGPPDQGPTNRQSAACSSGEGRSVRSPTEAAPTPRSSCSWDLYAVGRCGWPGPVGASATRARAPERAWSGWWLRGCVLGGAAGVDVDEDVDAALQVPGV
jgi:hypothetical protein